MKKKQFYTLLCAVSLYTGLAQANANSAESHDHNSEHTSEEKYGHDEGGHENEKEGHDDHEEEQVTRISEEMAVNVGIKTAAPQSQTLHQNIIVYGSLVTDPEQLSHVRARYSGLIKEVKINIGDRLKKGDLLARVESNESLKIYKVVAPISGTVIQRHANTGEITRDQVLFSIANFDTLWAEFRVYPAQQFRVKKGQNVSVNVEGKTFNGRIAHVIPALDKPFQLARVKFTNPNNYLSPGFLLEGNITVGKFNVKLAVEKNALQRMGEQSGVFVKEENEYHFTPLMTGRSDDHYVEVLSGLNHQQRYVSKNSYLIKADIEKSEAEHED